MESRYDDCGTVCGQTQKRAGQFCVGCPVQKKEKRFVKETLFELDKRIGEKWKKNSFKFLQRQVEIAIDLEIDGNKDAWFIGTEILVNIYLTELNKYKKAEHQKRMSE